LGKKGRVLGKKGVGAGYEKGGVGPTQEKKPKKKKKRGNGQGGGDLRLKEPPLKKDSLGR